MSRKATRTVFPSKFLWKYASRMSRPTLWAHSKCGIAMASGNTMRARGKLHRATITTKDEDTKSNRLCSLYCAPLYTSRSVTTLKDDEEFNLIQYWNDRHHSQTDLAHMALDVLAVPLMSDDCECLFSSAEDRKST